MTTKIKFLTALILVSFSVMAQHKKSFTLHDLIPGGSTYYAMQPQYMYTTWWGDCLVQTDVEQVQRIHPANGQKTTLFTLEQLNSWLALPGGKKGVRSLHNISFPQADQPVVAVTLPPSATGRKDTLERVWVDFEQGKRVWLQCIPAAATATDGSTQSRNTAYVLDHNLYVTTAQGHTMAVSTDGSDALVYGQSVHRDEFGISKGTFWSPDGQLLAFYRMDQSMVPNYPQVDITTRIASTYPCHYPMAGEPLHKVTVGVFNPATSQTVWLQAGDPTDRYFTNISWSPDSRKIYLIEVNRAQQRAELVRYDATTGQREALLYVEEHPKYVEPLHPIVFLPWDSSKFIYQSQRDGYNHLYLFNTQQPAAGEPVATANGGSVREYLACQQLTSGPWVVKQCIGFNSKEKCVLIQSNECHPIQSNLYKVNVRTTQRTLLDDGKGSHAPRMSKSGAYLADYYTSPSVPRQVNLIDVKKGRSLNLLDAADPWEGYNAPEITSGSIKAADGQTDLYYRLLKPVDFDPNKQYPAVVYVYGGPHAHLVEATWHYWMRGWEAYMAQLGYVVFVLDGRGSEYRGLQFEQVTYRHLGEEEMKDQMQGVAFLKSLPYVDGNRLGIHGWSYGGFMTTNLMLTYPDVFKVGVAGGPVIDWQYYESIYGERYMSTPQANPEGYKGSNLTLKAKNLKGRLQVIIGYNDPVCVPQHSLSFLRASIDAGQQIDFFMYPGDEHNMMGSDRVHLHERITQYFEEHLK